MLGNARHFLLALNYSVFKISVVSISKKVINYIFEKTSLISGA